MLALAIGITSAMFTILDAVVLRPVPFHAPDQLAMVYMGSSRGGSLTVTSAVLRAWRESRAFAAVEAALPGTALIRRDDSIVSRETASVTPGVFQMLGGVKPVLGRLFEPAEGQPGNDGAVLLSEDVWRTLYSSDATIVGRRIHIGEESLVVVGVLPADFRFPSSHTVIWKAADFSRAGDRPSVYVRFPKTMPRADSLRLATEAARSADAINAQLDARERPLAAMVLEPYQQRAVPLLAGGVILVFLVLAANASSLLLASVIARRQEYRTSAALGASRGRLMSETALEACVIGGLSLFSGLAIAWALVSAAYGLLPEALLGRTLNTLDLDSRALAVAAVSALLATFIAGVFPVWLGTRLDDGHALRVTEYGGTETRIARAVMRVLLVGEITLACMLLVGATLLVRSFVNLARVERGIDPRGVITATIGLPKTVFPDPESRAATARALEEQVRQLPSVSRVTWSYGLPPNGANFSEGQWTSDAPGASSIEMAVDHYNVDPEFFDLYRIPFLSGRTFEVTDVNGEVIVSQGFARALWPGLNPVGHMFGYGQEKFHVIGMVGEINYPTLDSTLDRVEFYHRFLRVGDYTMMSIRCDGACPDGVLIRARLVAAHPAVRVYEVRQPEDIYFEQLARPRAAAALAFAFATIAVLAAAGGLFAVLTYVVGRRRREFGIRSALGASPARLRQLVLRDSLTVAILGAGVGTVAALSLARTLASLQYGVTINDPASWAIVLGVLAATVSAATWRPAREAMRADPARLLKEE